MQLPQFHNLFHMIGQFHILPWHLPMFWKAKLKSWSVCNLEQAVGLHCVQQCMQTRENWSNQIESKQPFLFLQCTSHVKICIRISSVHSNWPHSQASSLQPELELVLEWERFELYRHCDWTQQGGWSYIFSADMWLKGNTNWNLRNCVVVFKLIQPDGLFMLVQ